MVDVLRVLAGLELLAVTLGFWAFTLLFHVLANWRGSVMGRHFMAFMLCCDLILTWSWIGFATSPPVIVRTWVALILYGALTIVVWRQVRILVIMQIIARDNPDRTPVHKVMEENNGAGSEPS
jgi:hypothetical protein